MFMSILQVLSITPSKDGATPLSTPGSDVVSRKRSDIDFDAFSDAKRRKTEKGKHIRMFFHKRVWIYILSRETRKF